MSKNCYCSQWNPLLSLLSLLLPCFSLFFLRQLFTAGQRFAAICVMVLPAGSTVAVPGAVKTLTGAGPLHFSHQGLDKRATPAQARPMPSRDTAVSTSRLPSLDRTTTHTHCQGQCLEYRSRDSPNFIVIHHLLLLSCFSCLLYKKDRIPDRQLFHAFVSDFQV